VWRADEHASGCVRARRAVSTSCTRVTAEGWRAPARTTGCRSSERALGRERVSSEMRRDDVGNRAPSGAGTDAVDLLSGRIRWHPTVLRGPCWDAAEVSPSGGAGANAIRRNRPFGGGRGADRTEPDKAGTPLPSLDVRVEGRRSGWAARRNVPSKDRAARNARQHRERDRSKAQGSIERARSGNVARNATDSSVEESPEVDEKDSAPWRHGSGDGSNGERARQSVNASRIRKDAGR